MSSTNHPKAIKKQGFARSQHKIGLPYPNYGLGPTELPAICRCFYDGLQFFVKHDKDMHILYQNGAFGRSSRTLRGPSSSLDRPYQNQSYYKKAVARNLNNSQEPICDLKSEKPLDAEAEPSISIPMDTTDIDLGNSNGVEIVSTTMQEVKFDVGRVNVNGDGECLSLKKAEAEEDPTQPVPVKKIEEERLILLPEEVIFLSFGVGCISIQHLTTGDTLSFQQVWNTLMNQRPEFPYFYAVYHYFRSKNWVPKDGREYGSDYVLYQVGPEFYHSTYIIHITGLPSRPQPKWTELYSWQRVASQISKFVLLCDVEVPAEFQCETSSPRSIFTMKLSETTIHRWTNSSA